MLLHDFLPVPLRQRLRQIELGLNASFNAPISTTSFKFSLPSKRSALSKRFKQIKRIK